MKTRVDLVLGFLGSGKTTYIEKWLEQNNYSGSIIQYEVGAKVLTHSHKDLSHETFDEQQVLWIVEEHKQKHLLIELNGWMDLRQVLDTLNKKALRKKIYIGNIVLVLSCKQFNTYYANFKEMMENQIRLSDEIVLTDATTEQEWIQVQDTLRKVDRKISVKSIERSVVKQKSPLPDRLVVMSILAVCLYLIVQVARSFQLGFFQVEGTVIHGWSTIFSSIIFQAFPFMLMGVFVSAMMQVWISKEWLVKIFPEKRLTGYMTALFGGLLLPVCECAIVPVTIRLIKKGVSVPIAITFMLAAPIINPIVIASTYFAFPGQPELIFIRLGFGLMIAMAIGITITVLGEKVVLLDNDKDLDCGCLYCQIPLDTEVGFGRRMKIVFLHAGDEFFDVGKFLVMGAALTATAQAFIPRSIFTGIGSSHFWSLSIMMLTAFVFSVCSTSDAFIARSFAERFSMGSVMGFMVFGPMLDIKNILMMMSGFRKAFILKLVLVIGVISFILLYFLTTFFF